MQKNMRGLAIESLNIGKGELPSESKLHGGVQKDGRMDLIIDHTPIVADLYVLLSVSAQRLNGISN